MLKTVFLGLVICWCRAIVPTNRSPLSVKPTTDGVVRPPVELVMIFGLPPSKTATTEFVVPRSIPIILVIFHSPFVLTHMTRQQLPYQRKLPPKIIQDCELGKETEMRCLP